MKHLEENEILGKILGTQVIPKGLSSVIRKGKKGRGAKSALTTDSRSIVEDPEIDLICELIGGVEEAKELTLLAFEHGKSFVYAKKALIFEHVDEFFKAAERAGVQYGFEASVAGGIPIIKVLRESMVANEFPLIYGILNGTSNYILTRMEKEGVSFDEVLTDARELGYVENDT